ncbi:protein lojap chloroplastic-like [Trifolium pratense]|uniref:Protein Iojap, chloroplastic n=1 Tax=Trifolium pratense TaxID=57577 RepID=A0A2K3NLM5_TRIPR|nr:protein lojap chloroplastic-like [Trifolium pratense]
MTPSSTFLSLAGPGVPVSFSGEMGHPQTKCSPKPRKVFSSFSKKLLPLQRHSINGLNFKRRNSLLSFAFGKEANDNFFSIQNKMFKCMFGITVIIPESQQLNFILQKLLSVAFEKSRLVGRCDSDISNVIPNIGLDPLLSNYGEVVYKRKDQKPASAELDDDAESLSFAVELATVASEVKAGDIKVLFVKPLVYWTRFFIIATAFSRPQIDAIGSRIRDRAEKKYGKIPSGDTKPNSWMLLDFGDVVVHLFLPPQRAFYNLEEFYGNATLVELPFENEQPFRNEGAYGLLDDAES